MGKKVIQKSEDLTNQRNSKADRGKAGSGKATQADKNRTKEIRGQSGNKKAANSDKRKSVSKKNDYKRPFLNENYYLLPLLFVLVIVPLIVKAHAYDTGLTEYAWGAGNTEPDFFLFWKGRFLVIAAAVMGIVMASGFYQKKLTLKKRYWIWLLLAFLGMITISTILSPYAKYTLSGTMGQLESIFVVFAYVFVAVYAFLYIKDQEDLEVIGRGILALTIVLSVLGLTQITGNDFFGSLIGKQLIQSRSAGGYNPDEIGFTFQDDLNHRVYLTLYNPNYVGVFSALVLPVMVGFLLRAKNWKGRLLWGAATIGIFVAAIGCGSRTFLLSIPVIVILVLLFSRHLIKKYWKLAAVVAAAVVIAVVGFYVKFDRNITEYIKSGFNLVEQPAIIDDFYADESGVHLFCRGESLLIQFERMEEEAAPSELFGEQQPGQKKGGVSIGFLDAMGQQLETYQDGDALKLENEAFRELSFRSVSDQTIENDGFITVELPDGQRILFIHDESGYHFLTENMMVDEPVDSEKTEWFGNHYHFFNRRGYIWAHTIPLLKEHLILGSGPDTFVYEFPQNDYVAKLQSENMHSTITRPHNMYMQMEIQYGLVALLCFLASVVLYIINCFKVYWKNDKGVDSGIRILGISFMCGVIGYMICGIANDSTVTVAPIFWAFLGIGFAINQIAAKNIERTAIKNKGMKKAAGKSDEKAGGKSAAKVAGKK